MDVFNISAGQAPKAPESGSVEHREALARGDQTPKKGEVRDSFASSAAAKQVEGLVEKLGEIPNAESRTDLIEKFRALMAVGELDTFESAERAAAGLLGGEPAED